MMFLLYAGVTPLIPTTCFQVYVIVWWCFVLCVVLWCYVLNGYWQLLLPKESSVTVKKSSMFLNICTIKIKILTQNSSHRQEWHQNTQNGKSLSTRQFIHHRHSLWGGKTKTCSERPHLASGHFMKVIYKTNTCPR